MTRLRPAVICPFLLSLVNSEPQMHCDVAGNIKSAQFVAVQSLRHRPIFIPRFRLDHYVAEGSRSSERAGITMTTITSWLSDPSRFPLRSPSEEVLERLYRSVWRWVDCSQCMNQGSCAHGNCPWTLRLALRSYQHFYHKITFRYTSEDWDESLPALKNHDDLLEAVRFVRDRPLVKKQRLMSDYFDSRPCGDALTAASKHRVFSLALNVLVMLPCADRNRFQDLYPILAPETWRDQESACEVVERAIPIGKPLSRDQVCTITQKLSARKLSDRGYQILVTDDLRQHLRTSLTTKSVYVYHQAGFLKADLWAQTHWPALQRSASHSNYTNSSHDLSATSSRVS